MQGLNVLLLFILRWYVLHVRSHQRRADRLRDNAIVLLILEVQFDILACDDFDRVGQGFALALPVKCTGAGFNSNLRRQRNMRGADNGVVKGQRV